MCQRGGTSQHETQVWCSDSETNVSPLSLKDNSGLVTEKRIFTMAGQVASALVGETAVGLSFCVSVSQVCLTASWTNMQHLSG